MSSRLSAAAARVDGGYVRVYWYPMPPIMTSCAQFAKYTTNN